MFTPNGQNNNIINHPGTYREVFVGEMTFEIEM